jgi:hypothetical protein
MKGGIIIFLFRKCNEVMSSKNVGEIFYRRILHASHLMSFLLGKNM